MNSLINMDYYYNPFLEPKNKIIVYDMKKGLEALKRNKKRQKRKVLRNNVTKKFHILVKYKNRQKRYYKNRRLKLKKL